MSSAEQGYPWFAIRTKARHEKMAALSLGAQGYEQFLPSYQQRDRYHRTRELPLFTGYLFCRFDPDCFSPILRSPGVVDVVRIGRVPAPVEDSEVDAIRQIVGTDLQFSPWPWMLEGDRVRLNAGPLTGLEGIYISSRGQDRIVISVTMLQRAIAVEIDRDWVTPLDLTVRRALSQLENLKNTA